MAKIITLISSTAGVGKTHFGVNLAYRLTTLGHRTCLFNTDSDTTSVYDLLGIRPQRCLVDLIKNRHSVDHIIHRSPYGIDFFPGTPGMEEIPGLKSNERDRFIRSVQELNVYDYFVLDTFPGLSRNVVAFSKASSAVILAMTPEPSALTDAYLFLKVLSGNGFSGSVMVLINKCKNAKTARSAYLKFKGAVETYLPANIQPLGSIFFDPHVEQAGEAKKPFLALYPETDASKCVDNIARHIVDKRIVDVAVSAFWSRFLQEIKHPFQLTVERPKNSLESEHREALSKRMKPVDSISEPPLSRSGETEVNMVPDVNGLLNQLMEQINTFSQDLEEMKHLIRNRNEPVTGPGVTSPDSRDSMVRIPLDFDAYVKKRKTGS
ncbi:MAG TPA: AAA family ATPase [Deltaproteobacteria bacterium]|nr:AAA family ATPase [Deltaproteobacteria bacterium]